MESKQYRERIESHILVTNLDPETYGFCPPRAMGYRLSRTYGLWVMGVSTVVHYILCLSELKFQIMIMTDRTVLELK
jgi:hypothetical protein